MENKEYRAWFENTRESNFKTIGQTETIFEGLVLKIASGAMAISFSFITALAPKIEYRCMWILAVGWGALAACIIWNILPTIQYKPRPAGIETVITPIIIGIIYARLTIICGAI